MGESSEQPKQKSWFARHKALTIIGVLIALGIIGSAAGGNNPSTPASTSTADKVATAASTPTPPTPTPTPAVPAEYTSALNQATSYANTQYMSQQGVYDQLVSPYGGQFSAAAATYAINNVVADWNANALATAKNYQTEESLSPAAIHDQLVSQYGEKFTEAQADYAIQHLIQ
jgi:hypothetical protein